MTVLTLTLSWLVLARPGPAAPPSPEPQPQRELPQMLSFEWSAAPPLPQGMQDNDGGHIDGFLVVAGGFCHGLDDDWKPGKYPRGFLKKAWALDLDDVEAGWTRIPDFPGAARQEMYGIAVGNAIYLWGGFNYSEPYTYRDGYRLTREDGEWTWESLPELPEPGAAGNIAEIDGTIYIVGGMDYDAKRYYVWTDRTGTRARFGSRLYSFDTRHPERGWKKRADCPGTPRMMAGVGATAGQLFVLGGYAVDSNGRAHCIVDGWRYDPGADRWHRVRDLPVAVAGFGSGAAVYRDRYILLPTGYPYETILDPDGGTRPRYGRPSRIDRSGWKQHPKLEGTTYENHFWVYDTKTDLYGTATPLPYDDHGPGTHVIGDSVYLFPGETAGFWWEGEYFGHAPEFVLRGDITLLDWEAGPDRERIARWLLVDDRDVLYRSGTARRLDPLERHAANPLLRPDRPWESGTVAYCSVHREPGTGEYTLWYQAWNPGRGCYLAYARSSDGIAWEKPELGLVEFNGRKDNNIVLKIGYGAGVVVDPRDPDPERRYKLAYWDRLGTCVAFSADGIHWREHPGNPVIRGSYGRYDPPRFVDEPDDGRNGPPLSTSDVTDPIWDPLRGLFAIYAKTWLDAPDGTMHWKRAVVRTESRDFIHWSKPQLVLWPDELDSPGDDRELARTAGGGGSGGIQLHSGPAFVDGDRYFCLLQVMDPGGTGTMPIELALSDDGYRWRRPFRKRHFIPPLDDKTRFDASLIWSNATPIRLDGVVRFYYGAYGRPWNSNDGKQISGIGLATMKTDRYAGVRPTGTIGQVTFRETDFSRVRAIQVNADATGGTVRGEILTENGYRLRGFTKEDAVPITGDAIAHRLTWKERTLGELPPAEYRLRVYLEGAELFGVSLFGYARVE